MNSLPLACREETGPYARCWAVSMLLHAVPVLMMIALTPVQPSVRQPESFKWEVSVVEPPRPQPVATPVPTPAKPAPAIPKPVETRPVETQPGIRSRQAQAVQMVQTVQQVVGLEAVREVSPVVQTSTQPTPMVSRMVQVVQAQQQTVPAATEAVKAAETQPVVRESAVVPASPAVATVTKHVIADPALLSPAEPAVISQPVVDETQAPAVVQERTVVREGTLKPSSPALIEQAPARELAVQFNPASRPDYSWLLEALWTRVEQLKRYPRLAQMHRWEGKVVLQAVIKEDGRLQDVVVAESSGHSVLDHDAMEILRRASPFKLKHPLGRPQVVVQVPISYRLEQ